MYEKWHLGYKLSHCSNSDGVFPAYKSVIRFVSSKHFFELCAARRKQT